MAQEPFPSYDEHTFLPENVHKVGIDTLFQPLTQCLSRASAVIYFDTAKKMYKYFVDIDCEARNGDL